VLPKSDIYLAFLPLIHSHRVELLDHARLASQLCGLQRFTQRGSRETVDHIPGHNIHDDVANAACGAIVYMAQACRADNFIVCVRRHDGQDHRQPAQRQRGATIASTGGGSPHHWAVAGAATSTRYQTQATGEQQRDALDDPSINVAARLQREQLDAKLAAIDAEQARIETAISVEQANAETVMAKAAADRAKETNREPNATELFYRHGGAATAWWEPPGGWTRRERF
jgi:hypothetical protein